MLRKLCYSVKEVQQKQTFRSSLQATKKMYLVFHVLTTFMFLTNHLLSHQLVYLKYHSCCSARHLFCWPGSMTIQLIHLLNVSHPKRHILEHLQQFSHFILNIPLYTNGWRHRTCRLTAFTLKSFVETVPPVLSPLRKKSLEDSTLWKSSIKAWTMILSTKEKMRNVRYVN